MAKDGHHVAVLEEGLGAERRDAPIARGPSQGVEEALADAQVLVVIADNERHFGARRRGFSVVTSDRHQIVSIHYDQRQAIDVVDFREVGELSLRELWMNGEVST